MQTIKGSFRSIGYALELAAKPYQIQHPQWPETGRHILAQYDDESVVVYQAFRSAIGNFATQHGYFGGEFKLTRMSWIKTSFLWMMYRCGWGEKADQECVLAIWLQRAAFDLILENAVPSTFVPGIYSNEAEWKNAIATSSVRLQWDPDHDPKGHQEARRAIQLGLRGPILAQYAQSWIQQHYPICYRATAVCFTRRLREFACS